MTDIASRAREALAQSVADGVEAATGLDCHALSGVLSCLVAGADAACLLHALAGRHPDMPAVGASVLVLATSAALAAWRPADSWHAPVTDDLFRPLTHAAVVLFVAALALCLVVAAGCALGRPALGAAGWAALGCLSQLGFAYAVLLRCCLGSDPRRVRHDVRGT